MSTTKCRSLAGVAPATVVPTTTRPPLNTSPTLPASPAAPGCEASTAPPSPSPPAPASPTPSPAPLSPPAAPPELAPASASPPPPASPLAFPHAATKQPATKLHAKARANTPASLANLQARDNPRRCTAQFLMVTHHAPPRQSLRRRVRHWGRRKARTEKLEPQPSRLSAAARRA